MTHFKFRNFSPTVLVAQYSRRCFHRLWESAPSDAAIYAQVERMDDQTYKARIEVRASSLQSVTETCGQVLKDVIRAATEGAKTKLSHWANGRDLNALDQVSTRVQ